MLAVILCLGGIAALLFSAELLSWKKLIKNETERKFLHISGGVFIAFWPWLISWRSIQIIGLAMLVVILAIRLGRTKLHFYSATKRVSYGDICFPLAVIICAVITDQNIFFALAILHMALADGLAAIVGKRYGQVTEYKVFHQTKTLFGSVVFWMVSLSLLGAGVLFAYDTVDFNSYVAVLVLLPPALTLLENVTPYGLDNLVIPVAVIAGLQVAQFN